MPITRSQILSALAPIISVISGALATWLFVHVHALGVFETKAHLAGLIASAVTFGVTAGLVWASAHIHWRLMLIAAAAARGREGVPIEIPPVSVILAVIGPYVSVIAGWLAAYLGVKLHVLSIFHVDQTQLTQTIAASVIFIVTSVITWLSNHDVITEELVYA